MTRVIATAWSRDGSRIYMRSMEFQGHDRELAEFVYAGVPRGGTVQFNQVVALRPPCECGMCSIAERILDEEFPPPRPRFLTDDDQPEDFE